MISRCDRCEEMGPTTFFYSEPHYSGPYYYRIDICKKCLEQMLEEVI